MSEVSFQLLQVDLFLFGIVHGFVDVFPHSGCGVFPSSCCVVIQQELFHDLARSRQSQMDALQPVFLPPMTSLHLYTTWLG